MISSEDPTNEQWLIDSSDSFESLFTAVLIGLSEESRGRNPTFEETKKRKGIKILVIGLTLLFEYIV